MHQTTFSTPYRNETIKWKFSGRLTELARAETTGITDKAGWPAYFVIESLKTYNINLETGLTRLTDPAGSMNIPLRIHVMVRNFILLYLLLLGIHG